MPGSDAALLHELCHWGNHDDVAPITEPQETGGLRKAAAANAAVAQSVLEPRQKLSAAGGSALVPARGPPSGVEAGRSKAMRFIALSRLPNDAAPPPPGAGRAPSELLDRAILSG